MGELSPNPHLLQCKWCEDGIMRRGRPRTSSGDPKTRCCCVPGLPCGGAREHLWAWRPGRNTSGAVGWGAPGRVGGAAAGVGRLAGPAPSTSQCLEAPEPARNPSGCGSAGTQRDECPHLVPTPFLRSRSELGSDLGIRPVRPQTGAARSCFLRTRLGGVPNGVRGGIAHLRPQGLCLT